MDDGYPLRWRCLFPVLSFSFRLYVQRYLFVLVGQDHGHGHWEAY
jgi:hypothetical protein